MMFLILKIACLIAYAMALAGLAGVWFTRSRGGILGAAVACGVMAAGPLR